ncbi:MAG TPA: alcohol dehydrogenase catalytic domain-containing protein, partial [Acidimicrobiales bacterium]|nr:alcohol dehydrogenase catalytic domain-containing protein [Acidimicrobiales bacterium]
MRAVSYIGDRSLAVVDVDPRAPAVGEVAIDVGFTGICGTDLHVLHGAMDHRVQPPAILGHEMAGTIAVVGDGVERWSVGAPVSVMPLRWCGQCAACRAGHTHICHHLDFIGLDSPGSMQNQWVVPADTLVAIPPTLALTHAALAEPTAVAVHDVNRAMLRGGEHVVVVGGGPIGMLVASVARARGAQVVLLEVSEQRLELARGLGLRALDPTQEDAGAFIADWTAGAGAEVAFEVSGAVTGLQAATEALAARGRLVVVAIHSTAPPVDLFRLFWRELTIVGARVYERADFEEAMRLLETGAIPAEVLITNVVALEDAALAFAQLESGTAMKVLIECAPG